MPPVSSVLSNALNRPGASSYARQFFSPMTSQERTSFAAFVASDGADLGVSRGNEPADAPVYGEPAKPIEARNPYPDIPADTPPLERARIILRRLGDSIRREGRYTPAEQAGAARDLPPSIFDLQRIGFLVLGGGLVIVSVGALVAPRLGFGSLREEWVRSNAITTNRAVRGAFDAGRPKKEKRARSSDSPPASDPSPPAPDTTPPAPDPAPPAPKKTATRARRVGSTKGTAFEGKRTTRKPPPDTRPS